MAQFNYEEYNAQNQARRSANNNSSSNGLGPEVHFMGEFLKTDGDVVVVRFPYHSMKDITFETTHLVNFPGKKFGARVRCPGANCPFCVAGEKASPRFFVKALVYNIDDSGAVKIINTVWDRPSAFADIDIKNLMQEYGDISQQLFKIKRNGSGTGTRYTISIIMNNTVYNPAVYKADFSELDLIDPAKILSKSVAQYNQAVNPTAVPESAPVEPVEAMPAPAPFNTYEQPVAPVNNISTLAYTQPVEAAPTVAEQPVRRQTKYSF